MADPLETSLVTPVEQVLSTWHHGAWHQLSAPLVLPSSGQELLNGVPGMVSQAAQKVPYPAIVEKFTHLLGSSTGSSGRT
jgi:hypothetical protein